MILVTGGTGTAGSEVVRALLDRGRGIRVFARDADKARRLFGDAVEVAHGDFADARSFDAALDGVDELVLSCADDPRRVGWETRAIDAAAAAGVRRVVKLSAIGAEPGSPVAFWDWHGRVERHVWDSPVSAVILRSSFYMSNVTAVEGRIYAPAGEARISMVDPRDVGAATAAVVGSAEHDGRKYLLTGPEAITYSHAAEELSAATGSAVRFVDVPADAAPRQLPGELVELFAMIRLGAAQQVTAAVETLTGRPARDFGAYAREHAAPPALAGAPR